MTMCFEDSCLYNTIMRGKNVHKCFLASQMWELPLLPPSTCISRKLEWGAELGLNPCTTVSDACIPSEKLHQKPAFCTDLITTWHVVRLCILSSLGHTYARKRAPGDGYFACCHITNMSALHFIIVYIPQ